MWFRVFSVISFLLFALQEHVAATDDVKVTILSDNLADVGIEEWGFAALIETQGKCILFDTGRNPDTVIKNAQTLGKDLSCVTDVVLSHFHGDHTGGLISILKEHKTQASANFLRLHVGKGIFTPRYNPKGRMINRMVDAKQEIEALGVQIHEYAQPTEIAPSIWVTGTIDRTYPEKNFNPANHIKGEHAHIQDTLQDDMALTIIADQGHIVLAGCGHAGIINTLTHIKTHIADKPIATVIGGFHLLRATPKEVSWTAEKMQALGVQSLVGAHCSGQEKTVPQLQKEAGLTERTAVIGATGMTYTLSTGIRRYKQGE